MYPAAQSIVLVKRTLRQTCRERCPVVEDLANVAFFHSNSHFCSWVIYRICDFVFWWEWNVVLYGYVTASSRMGDGTVIARVKSDMVCAVMKANANHGFEYRWSGRRRKIVRKNLVALGVFHEVNMDGHEKLSSKALKMGPASIPIYVAIGHVYLDFVERYGAIPLQVTVDKGSETGDMYAMHTTLR
ncbi:hypothetical protein PILCRDRAFT_16160 [Piloderma croceum F 1598]|uniref:Uncharacterized protein n=1 Tax=Piloderma croceum (strain F 1598) TaxID=765440 RepID=A0A0C3B530_PILCF|nr:hypothetical protein PILCRDRAFT_16160 [Piloderma croceum F 1598]